MTSDEPNRQDPATVEQLNQALRLAWALATTLGISRGTIARETKLALRAADALQELHELLEPKP